MEWNNSLSFVPMKKSLYRICTYKVVLLKHLKVKTPNAFGQ